MSARAGLMWPPVSLEHEGADWHVRDSITPSAINSWIGEEVRPVAVEGDGRGRPRGTQATGDRSGHGGERHGGHSADLPRLGAARPHDACVSTASRCRRSSRRIPDYQAPFTHPLLDVPDGFADRPGYYAKLAWQPPVPVRIELFRYDNRADPEAVNDDLEWGWRTRFNQLAAVADLGSGTAAQGARR